MVQQPPQNVAEFYWWPIQAFLQRATNSYWMEPWKPTSWWRSTSSNLAAGGAEYSQHLIATAVDAYPDSGNLEALEAAFRRAGLIPVRYPRHVHAQLYQAGVLERFLRGLA